MNTTLLRERLARQVSGRVLDGGGRAAAAEVAGFNTAVAHRPSVVVAAECAGDVAAAVRYAADTGSSGPAIDISDTPSMRLQRHEYQARSPGGAPV